VAANDARSDVTPIVQREKTSALREAVAVAFASDWHIEESVDPAAISGMNRYNLEIARYRAGRFFAGYKYLVDYHSDHFKIRDGILGLGGDLITGFLHPDQVESNNLSPVQAIATIHEWIADGIRSVLGTTSLELLRVPCVSGNHGRTTEKMRSNTREANSYEWLLYRMLAREFANEPRVQFAVPAGAHQYVQCYDWTLRFLHGDQVKGGGGIGGISVPILKALSRWQTLRHADWTFLGHFHQMTDLRDIMVNGSLIGYSPYALDIGARYEEPQQLFTLIDSRRGKTMSSSIWVGDKDEEAKIGLAA
jgi:hypothetical protein